MNAEGFVDTNVVVYAVSSAGEDQRKRQVARGLLSRGGIGLSAQVLQEFYVTATRKIRVGLSHEEAMQWLGELEQMPCVPLDASLVWRAAKQADRYQLSYWDGAIIAAAERLGAQTVYTEDLNHGQQYGSVTAINPFRNE